MTGPLRFSGTTHEGVLVISLTTAQHDALTPANGMLIYNTTTSTFQKYEASAWLDWGGAGTTGFVEVAGDTMTGKLIINYGGASSEPSIELQRPLAATTDEVALEILTSMATGSGVANMKSAIIYGFENNVGSVITGLAKIICEAVDPTDAAQLIELQIELLSQTLVTFRNNVGGGGGNQMVLADALNIVLNATTGTKIGTATTQKLGFWNATPVVQPASANQAALSLDVDVTGIDTVDLTAINANFTSIQTLVNQLRSDLVTAGLIKGAA